MKQATTIPLKRIVAMDSQLLIQLKLRHNALADKINTFHTSEAEREKLLAKLALITIQIETYLF